MIEEFPVIVLDSPEVVADEGIVMYGLDLLLLYTNGCSKSLPGSG